VDTHIFERVVELEHPQDTKAVEALVTRVFGPGRFAKTAERLREKNQALKDMCFVVRSPKKDIELEPDLIGSVRLWPIKLLSDGGQEPEVSKLAFLGPIAVDPLFQGHGLGRALVEAGLRAAFEAEYIAVILVGTPSYFEKFGFVSDEHVYLNGPVDPKRILVSYNSDYKGQPLRGLLSR
jgi:predicted N-acetyltransferase YhbS